MEVENPQSWLLKIWVNLTVIRQSGFLSMSGVVLDELTSGWRRESLEQSHPGNQ